MGLFREYDLRGIVGEELTEAIAEQVGRAYCTMARERGVKTIRSGRDGRLSSPGCTKPWSRDCWPAGMNVVDVGLCASPLLYFSLFHLPVEGGIMITGSHNAAEYNGFKICIGKEAIHGEDIQQLRRVMEVRRVYVRSGQLSEHPIIPDYLAYIKKSFIGVHANHLHVVIDCGNGAACVGGQASLGTTGLPRDGAVWRAGRTISQPSSRSHRAGKSPRSCQGREGAQSGCRHRLRRRCRSHRRHR